MGKQKFKKGDKVIITAKSDPHYSQIGYVYNYFYDSIKERTEYCIKGLDDDKIYGNYRSYELCSFCLKQDNSIEKLSKKEIDNTITAKTSKIILIFDEDIFKNAPSEIANYVKRMATKINIDDTVLKNQYGESGIKEKVFFISLEDAQKMYKNGGALKEFVLKYFTEDELNPKPKVPHTWEEYCTDFYPYEYHLHYKPEFVHGFRQEDCNALIAYGRLIRLYRSWIGKWEPDWNNDKIPKWCIQYWKNTFEVLDYYLTPVLLSFPTKEMANDFMNCFKDLLNNAKTLF